MYSKTGRDTTAQALSWMFYSLNREGADQTVIDTLVQEVDDVLQGGQPTYETYKQQKFAEAWYVCDSCNTFSFGVVK